MGTYVRPNIYNNTNNQNLSFKRLAVVFHQNKSIGVVNSFEEINNSALLTNVMFNSFYKSNNDLNKVKEYNFENNDNTVLDLTENINIPKSGSISVLNFINSIQYKINSLNVSTVTNNYTLNNNTAGITTYLQNDVIKLNINANINSTSQSNPALNIDIDNIYTYFLNIKHLYIYVNNSTIKGYNGVGLSTYGNNTNYDNKNNGITGGNGQDGQNGGNAINIISNNLRSTNKVSVYIIKLSNAKIVKGYGANGGDGGNGGSASVPATYHAIVDAHTTYTHDSTFKSTADKPALYNSYIINGAFFTARTLWFFTGYVPGGGNGERAYLTDGTIYTYVKNKYELGGKDNTYYMKVGDLNSEKYVSSVMFSGSSAPENSNDDNISIGNYTGNLYDIKFYTRTDHLQSGGEQKTAKIDQVNGSNGGLSKSFGAEGYNENATGVEADGSGTGGKGGKHGEHGRDIYKSDETNINYFLI
jgi:hypothetical protein